MFGYTIHIWKAFVSFVQYFIVHFIFGREGSYPGDAIANPLQRRAKWRNRTTFAPAGWKFATDKESIEVTERSSKYTLTGESVGRQVWYKTDAEGSTAFDFNPHINPNSGDKILRDQLLREWKGPVPDSASRPATAREAARKGVAFYQMLQCSDGHWAGDYGGPMFLMPGLIIALYICQAPLSEWRVAGMTEYLLNHQQEDGGWGTHIECASTMFGTILSYISLRLLGSHPEEEHMKAAREFILSHGGGLYAPSWAKFWMAVLGVYDWSGINSIPVELWCLPRWFPFHPGRMWCHSRMVYLPMGYMYCKRVQPPQAASDPVLQALRRELYAEPYESIDWDRFRQTCAAIDEYSPLAPVMKIAQDVLAVYEQLLPSLPQWFRDLRQRGLDFVIRYIHAEDLQTNYIDIGPVNKALNLLAVWVDGGMTAECEAFQRHLARVDDYLWVAEDGMKMNGYNGSQCWDTSFAAQAIVDSGLASDFPQCSARIYGFLNRCQIKNDEADREIFFRHISRGGWPFSTSGHGWPISDCTSEGLKAVIALNRSIKQGAVAFDSALISDDRLFDSLNVILSYQNHDGGWATYENNRGYRWYEMLNPSEVFGDIMIDYSYVECTSACVTALKAFSAAYPAHRAAQVLTSIQAGRRFLKAIQRTDGSWYGSWGNCFTYGTWFGIEGLVAAGEPLDSHAISTAVEFLASKQNPNGGWGESYVACVNKSYPADGTGPSLGEDGSGVVQTAWALLGGCSLAAYCSQMYTALMAAEYKQRSAIDRGIRYLMRKQCDNGDWLQEGITGVFNRSCGITYTAYRNVFPFWALARYAQKYES